MPSFFLYITGVCRRGRQKAACPLNRAGRCMTMIINSSAVGMGSARSYHSASATMRRFTIKNYEGDPEETKGALDTGAGDAGSAEGSVQDQGTETRLQGGKLEDWQNHLRGQSAGTQVRSQSSQTAVSIRQTTVRYIFDLLYNARRNRLSQWLQDRNIPMYGSGSGSSAQNIFQNSSQVKGGSPVTPGLKVLTYSQETAMVEEEHTSFSTQGTVRTADGREIQFQVNVGMSRRFEEYFREDIQMGAFTMCDPLVINLDTDCAELSDQTFYFDIDADGELDEISGLGPGSGWLALDKNGDGVINDGSELFGTSSGNGFADLAQYDQDGNGWIDENDPVWDKLKIWCKDENGKDVLYKLSDKGVGAVCLQNVSTDFTLKGEEGRTKGAVRRSGVFLYENGAAGTIQHVDVAKYYAKA